VYEDSTDFIFTKGSYSIKNKNWNNINDMVEYYKKSTVVSLEIKKDKKPNDDWWYIMQLFD
jgi:outer membrane protein OmpA-like peptidoglycan-associated protein